MQAVILAAGRGKRMGILTEDTPKPLLRVGEKTLIEYKLDILPDSIDEVVIVVGYLNGKIQQHLGNRYGNKKIIYALQNILNGTAGALYAAQPFLKNSFLVMMGDDIYSREDVEECALHQWAICAKKVCNVEHGGELILRDDQSFEKINEPKHFIEQGYVNTALYTIHEDFFSYDMMPVENTGEFGIPHTLVSCAKKEYIKVIVSEYPWTQISDQKDIENFENTFLKKLS